MDKTKVFYGVSFLISLIILHFALVGGVSMVTNKFGFAGIGALIVLLIMFVFLEIMGR